MASRRCSLLRQVMWGEAEKRIGQLYPKVKVTADMVKGRPDLKPYVARNSRHRVAMGSDRGQSESGGQWCSCALARTFVISTKEGNERG